MKTKQYYKITCQNKHPHYQDKTILQDHLPKQTPTLSRQNNVTRLHVKNKHPHNQDKTILQDDMTKETLTQSRKNNIIQFTCQNKHPHNQNKTILQEHTSKQTPTQSRQNNITRSHVKTNTNSMKTKEYYKNTWQNKHPHNRDKTIFQDHMSKQTPTQWRQNNNTRSHVKTNTSTIKTK